MEPAKLCHACPALSSPANGYVRIINAANDGLYRRRQQQQLRRGSSGGGRHQGAGESKAIYSCEEGYMLTFGDEVRTCGIMGNWRGTQPVCKCESLTLILTDI